jgi:hypothetical protein
LSHDVFGSQHLRATSTWRQGDYGALIAGYIRGPKMATFISEGNSFD